jgi:hypothetical protein
MNGRLSKAFSDDAGGLKEKIGPILASLSPNKILDPPLHPGMKKSEERGWLHPILAKHLCPQRHLATLAEDFQG